MEETQLNVAIPKELDKQLEIFCIDEDVKKKEAVKQALELYFQMAKKLKEAK